MFADPAARGSFVWVFPTATVLRAQAGAGEAGLCKPGPDAGCKPQLGLPRLDPGFLGEAAGQSKREEASADRNHQGLPVWKKKLHPPHKRRRRSITEKQTERGEALASDAECAFGFPGFCE